MLAPCRSADPHRAAFPQIKRCETALSGDQGEGRRMRGKSWVTDTAKLRAARNEGQRGKSMETTMFHVWWRRRRGRENDAKQVKKTPITLVEREYINTVDSLVSMILYIGRTNIMIHFLDAILKVGQTKDSDADQNAL